jgi:hypothetical protein
VRSEAGHGWPWPGSLARPAGCRKSNTRIFKPRDMRSIHEVKAIAHWHAPNSGAPRTVLVVALHSARDVTGFQTFNGPCGRVHARTPLPPPRGAGSAGQAGLHAQSPPRTRTCWLPLWLASGPHVDGRPSPSARGVTAAS